MSKAQRVILETLVELGGYAVETVFPLRVSRNGYGTALKACMERGWVELAGRTDDLRRVFRITRHGTNALRREVSADA